MIGTAQNERNNLEGMGCKSLKFVIPKTDIYSLGKMPVAGAQACLSLLCLTMW